MAPRMSRSAWLGCASRRSAWSLWQAKITLSKRSAPAGLWIVTPCSSRSTSNTGQLRRICWLKPLVSGDTYALDPPSTTYHCGRSFTDSSPWFLQKRMKNSSGNSSMSAGDIDQIAAPMGTM